jgi:CHASE2 domain-containing sensor protein
VPQRVPRHPVEPGFVVIVAFHAIAVWGVVAVLRARGLTPVQRATRITGIVLIIVLLIAWVIFLWPAYWD